LKDERKIKAIFECRRQNKNDLDQWKGTTLEMASVEKKIGQGIGPRENKSTLVQDFHKK
jgi:hypothetical protein